MAERSFEEQVREELSGLELKPDEAIWQHVEATLHTEKKRRWLIWLLLFLAGSAAFWLYTPSGKENVKDITRDNRQEASGPMSAKKLAAITPEKPIKDEKKEDDETKEDDGKDGDAVSVTGNITSATSPLKKQVAALYNKETQMQILQVPVQPLNKPAGNSPAATGQPANLTGVDSAGIQQRERLAKASPAPDTKENPVSSADSVTTAGQDKQPLTATVNQDSLLPVTANETQPLVVAPIKKAKVPWQWYATFDMGRSGERKGFAPFASLDALNQSNSPGGIFNPGNAATPVPVFRIPSRTDAFSFSLALQANKAIGKKSSVGISLGYGLYQAGIGIGRRVDSLASFSAIASRGSVYYLSTDSTRYRNKYHFAELGVDFYTQFALGKRLSLRWRVGAGTAVLVGEDVLHFNIGSGTLYKNRSMIPALQLNMSTGIDIGIGKNPVIYVGPQLGYFITKSSRQSGSDKHLFRGAIRATVAIPKKKK